MELVSILHQSKTEIQRQDSHGKVAVELLGVVDK